MAMPETATSSRIADAFAAAREQGRAALMPYMMGGFPDRGAAKAIADAYVEAGADLIELGIPFSDPLADGPVIHAAATEALENGATLQSALEAVSGAASRVPVVAMCYSNMILAAGEEEFAAAVAAAGLTGVIVPDLPLGEGDGIRAALEANGIALIPLVALTTPPARRKQIWESAQGFIYAVSVVGTTGERRGDAGEALRAFVGELQRHAEVPVAVGFGISTPEQVGEFGRIADGVIVGTRLVRAVAETGDSEAAANAVAEFIRQSREALTGG
jgi:tryptophan synthase alpha chain